MDQRPPPLFELLTEVSIINQLATSALEACLPAGLIAAHFAVMNHLIRVGDGRTPVDIARALQVPKTSFSNTLAGLSKRGLIDVRPNPEDQRSKTLWITDAGRRVHRETIAGLAQSYGPLFQHLDQAEIAALLPGLRAVRSAMDALRD